MGKDEGKANGEWKFRRTRKMKWRGGNAAGRHESERWEREGVGCFESERRQGLSREAQPVRHPP